MGDQLVRVGLFSPLASVILPICKKCLAGKLTRKPLGKVKCASTLLDLIHSDICGPFNVKAQNGCSYYITFIEDFLRYGHIYLISLKSKALIFFQRYLAEMEKRLNRHVKILKTDQSQEISIWSAQGTM